MYNKFRRFVGKTAGVLGVKLEDVKEIKIGPEEIKKIVSGLGIDDLKSIMDAIPDDDEDGEEDSDLDF